MNHTPAGRRRRVVGIALVGLAVVASACGSNKSPVATTTSTTAPPAPSVTGWITRIGTGANVGLGSTVVPWNLTTGASGAGKAIAVGTFPAAEALTPNGKTLLVANYGAGTLTPIDVATGIAGKAVEVGNGPAGIAITPDGKTAYVTDAGLATLADTVTPVNLVTDKPDTPITVGQGPEGIAITPDGTRAYVADSGAVVTGQAGPVGHTVTPIDLTTGKALAPIDVGNAPGAVAITKDGATAYVTNANSGSLTPIAVATNTPGASISMPGAPSAIALNATTAWVTVGPSGVAHGDVVVPVALATNAKGAPIPVGKGPSAIALTSDGQSAWVICYASQTIESLNLAAGTHGTTITVPGGPYALVLTTGTPASASTSKTKKKK